MKKHLSLLLVVLMCLSLVPAAVFAAPELWDVRIQGNIPFEYGVTYLEEDDSQSSDTTRVPKGMQTTVFFAIPNGYEIDTVSVQESINALVPVTFSQGADYIEFRMPDNSVEVDITFKQTSNPPKPAAPRFKSLPQDASAAEKGKTTFSVSALGATTYQWYAVGTKGGKDVQIGRAHV